MSSQYISLACGRPDGCVSDAGAAFNLVLNLSKQTEQTYLLQQLKRNF